MKSFLAAFMLMGFASSALASGVKQLNLGETVSLQSITAQGADVVSCGSPLPTCEIDVYETGSFYVLVSGTVVGVWDRGILADHNRTESLKLVKELQDQKVCQGIQFKAIKNSL
jgi:hypothetical protein